MPCLAAHLLPSRPKKSYNSSTSTPEHHRKTQHLHEDCNIKITNTSFAYTAGFWNSSIDSTKTEYCTMLVIDKGPNKGLLFDPNKGSNLGHPVGLFLLSRIFTTANSSNHTMVSSQIQSHDGFITQWIFSFLPLQPSRILSMDSHPVTDRDCGSPHIVGFSFFATNHTNLNGSTRWGSPFRPPPWAQSLIFTVHGLGLIPQRHTHWGWFLKDIPRVRIFPYSPRTSTRTKCLQNPWGVTFTMEHNHPRRLQDVVGFFFFTTTNQQIPTGTTYTGLIFFWQ